MTAEQHVAAALAPTLFRYVQAHDAWAGGGEGAKSFRHDCVGCATRLLERISLDEEEGADHGLVAQKLFDAWFPPHHTAPGCDRHTGDRRVLARCVHCASPTAPAARGDAADLRTSRRCCVTAAD